MKLEIYLHFAQRLARQAGRLLKRLATKSREIFYKGSRFNLVTKADKESEALIIKAIRRKFPDHQIVSEEKGIIGNNRKFQWLIDPLDGTVNYSHQVPLYAVSLCLIYNKDVILGVVYNPCLSEMFYALKGKGAFLNHKQIKVSKTNLLWQSLVVTGLPYHFRKNPHSYFQTLQAVSINTQAVRRLGSAALDLCYVACGRFDAFWEKELNPWDVAAGSLILTEAGGKITDFKGRAYDIYHPVETLATNGKIHRQMIKILNSC